MVIDMKKAIGLILVAMFLSMGLSQLALYAKPPMWHGNTSTIETSEMVVRFLNNRPWYQIWIPGKNQTATYIVKFNRIVEFLDTDADNSFDYSDETLAQAILYEATWKVSAQTINGSEGVELRITFNAMVQVTYSRGGMPPNFVNVTFVNRIYDHDAEVEGIPIKGNRELKIDIIIDGWPWANPDSKLALEIVYAGMFRGKQGTPRCEARKYQIRNRYMGCVRLQGEDAGYYAEFRYQTQARLMSGDTEKDIKVNSTNSFTKNSATTWLVYPHFDGTLIHDPSIYVGSEGALATIVEYLPIIALLIVVAVVIVAVAKRRK